jgi:hypothetical protein
MWRGSGYNIDLNGYERNRLLIDQGETIANADHRACERRIEMI